MFAAVVAIVRADVTPLEPRVRPAVSAETDPAPLLVVLHGNNETANERAAKWREAVVRRGWKLLALDCPRELGCNDDGQWYAWNGDSRWLFERVRAFADQERVDTTRIYLAGWSGGATYIGKRMSEWPTVFAAVVIHGGGVPPRTDACPRRRFPAYFLVGDENPAHGGAKRLRAYMEQCGQPVRWDLLPGANHLQEDAALTPMKADDILRWLESQQRVDAFS
jgi:poly(3-hydroxybutyrate) depolymerase